MQKPQTFDEVVKAITARQQRNITDYFLELMNEDWHHNGKSWRVTGNWHKFTRQLLAALDLDVQDHFQGALQNLVFLSEQHIAPMMRAKNLDYEAAGIIIESLLRVIQLSRSDTKKPLAATEFSAFYETVMRNILTDYLSLFEVKRVSSSIPIPTATAPTWKVPLDKFFEMKQKKKDYHQQVQRLTEDHHHQKKPVLKFSMSHQP